MRDGLQPPPGIVLLADFSSWEVGMSRQSYKGACSGTHQKSGDSGDNYLLRTYRIFLYEGAELA